MNWSRTNWNWETSTMGIKEKKNYRDTHSEDLQEIIARPPSWLMRQGIGFVLLTVVMIVGMSAFIRYPETVKTSLRINALNAPKVVVTKVPGNIVRLLIGEGEVVTSGQELAFMESTAKHEDVLNILDLLYSVRDSSGGSLDFDMLSVITSPALLRLGELQGAYQNFYQAYLSYMSTLEDGIYLRKRGILLNELKYINEQENQMRITYGLQGQELEIARQEYEKYRVLAEKQVISPQELKQQEALLLGKEQSIPQMENNLLTLKAGILGREKELSELDNSIQEEKKKFNQALNSLISEAESWKKQYVISAPTEGQLIYSGILQENQFMESGSTLFYVNPDNASYFGEMYISQHAFGRIKPQQNVLVKLHSFPYEEYGYIKGQVQSISDIPIRDSVFLARVELHRTPEDSLIRLKPGILADADVITDDRSVLERIWYNMIKSIKL